MYHTVQWGMPPSQGRERLLAAAVEQAVHGGIIGQSLRQIAAATGTSHRMLLYHFGSRDGLLAAICNAINADVASTLDRWTDPQELFRHFADPVAWPWERLFFELYAHALFGGPGSEEFFEAGVHRWIDGLAGELVMHGADEAAARIQARVHLAVARGLLLDLLATKERAEVNQAYEYYLQLTGYPAQTSDRPGTDGSSGGR
jgi:AcrR family transcriptional regulator